MTSKLLLWTYKMRMPFWPHPLPLSIGEGERIVINYGQNNKSRYLYE